MSYPLQAGAVSLASFPTSVDLDFLKLSWSISSSGIAVSAKIDIGPLHWEQSLDLTYSHPSVSVSTPKVADYSASVSLSFDDSTGKLSASAKVTWWLFGDHDKTVSHDVEILPPNILGLVAQGCSFPAILDEAGEIASGGLTYAVLGKVKSGLARAASLAGLKLSEANDFIVKHSDLVTAAFRAAPDAATCAPIAAIPASALAAGLHAVVNDARIQAHFPGIAQRITFPDGYMAPTRVQRAAAASPAAGASVGEIIVDILETVGVLLGTAVALFGALAALIAAILAAVVAGPAVAGVALFALVFGIIAAAIVLAGTILGAVIVVIVLIAKGIMMLT